MKMAFSSFLSQRKYSISFILQYCVISLYHYKFVTNATLIMYAQVLYVTLSAGFFLFFIFNQEGIDSF